MQLGMFLGLIASLGFLCTLSATKPSRNPELCVVTSPLVTPYFTPWLDTPRKAHGCWAEEHHLVGPHEVHVLFLQGPPEPGSVVLELKQVADTILQQDIHNHEKEEGWVMKQLLSRLALVLSADKPVTWHLQLNSEDLSKINNSLTDAFPLIVMSEGSSVNADFALNQSYHVWANKKDLQQYIEEKFPVLASYTEVHNANHISLSIGMAGGRCNIHSQAESRVVSASQTVQLDTAGCFNENYIGDNPMDVYVVELDAGGRGHRPNRAPLPVLVQLRAEDGWTQPHEVALVLKSHQPVRWQFGPTAGLISNIIVVSDREDLVENSSSQKLKVISRPLPDSLDELLLLVATNFSSPILYAKIGHASTLRLLIGSKSKTGLRNGSEHTTSSQNVDTEDSHELMQQQPNYSGSTFMSGFPAPEAHGTAVGRLEASMIVQCEKTRIVVTFPAALVQELGVTHMHFSDVTCEWQLNATHVKLSSHITSCGTTSDTNGKLTTFSNTVHFKFGPSESDDEDFEASGSSGDGTELDRIPVVCKYQPHFPGNKFDISGSDFIVDSLDSETSNPHSLYHLDIYRDRMHTQKIEFSGSRTAIAEVEYDETLYVKAWMDGVVSVHVVTENCWLSNMSNPRQRPQLLLLRNTCPKDLSVQLTHVGEHGSFSFQVSHIYESMGKLYLHCRLGVCTRDPARAKGNLVLCVDPKQYCSSKSLRPYLDKAVSTAQQLATQGPLQPVSHRHKLPSTHVSPSSRPPDDSLQTEVVYIGISTEVTVGIALASFAIGVGLTGTLWCIHVKTDPFRRQCDKQLQRQGPPVASCNLSSRCGCSSSNSQVAMATAT